MTVSGHGTHHLHLRKRIHSKHEKYPSQDKKIRILDKVIYVVGVLGPIMLLPQIIKIFTSKNAEGVSFISYAFFTLFSGVWLCYGIVHREKPIIVTNVLWIIFHSLVSISVLIYGKGFL